MMDRRYREELDQIRLTEESKTELTRALAARRTEKERPRGRRAHRWSRTAVLAAALAGALALSVGAAVVVSPVLRSHFGDSAGYQQSAAELGQSVTKDGWTMTLTDCMGDDRNLWFGLEIAGPEGTVLDAENYYIDWYDCQFPGLYSFLSTTDCTQLPDDDPTDNRVQFALRLLGRGPYDGSFNGQRVKLTFRDFSVWNQEKREFEPAHGCEAVWQFDFTVSYPDSVIRLEPNLPVHTLGVDAVLTSVEISPFGVYASIEGDALKGHHQWVPRNAPDGWYGCIEYQEVTLTTKDGEVITPCDSVSGSGCSGGDLDHPEEGYLRLARWSDTLLDVDNLASVSICGVEIPLA